MRHARAYPGIYMNHEDKEGERGVKRIIKAALAMALLFAAASYAQAQAPRVQVYVAQGALKRETATRLVELAAQTYPQAEWETVFGEDEGVSLRELVLSDCAPQIVICAPQEALAWAGEGLLLPLEGHVSSLARMQAEVVEACVRNESLYMAPLVARHRRVAVNGRLLSAMGLGYLLDERAHPVWMPSELYQVIEEAAIRGELGMEIWLPQAEASAGLEAFAQSLYGGRIVAGDGRITADSQQMIASVAWLRDMTKNGLIGRVQERETALAHFLAGETLIFLDWTEEDARLCGDAAAEELALYVMPYPSGDGTPQRTFELVGAAVFAGQDAQAVDLAAQAVSLWTQDTRAQAELGERGVWDDGADWLPCLGAREDGATLRSLFAQALGDALEGARSAQDAMRQMAAVARTVTPKQ